jgi:hypothetical protein
MVQFKENNILFSASVVQATFADGTTLELTNITSKTSTPLGDELILSSTEEENRIVRLYLISPDRDWRSNQTYAWKVSSAWMSDLTFDWLHWNVNEYIDSQIQVPDDSSVFSCSRMEFHFEEIVANGLPRHNFYVVPSSKIILWNVHIGAHLPSNTTTKTYRPCPSGGQCLVIDGVVSSRFDVAYDYFNWQTAMMLASILALLYISHRWCRTRRARLYEQIAPTPEEDLNLAVEN